MSYIIKDDDHFLRMEDYVRRFDICLSIEKVGHIDLASEYSSIELAQEHVSRAEKENGYDISKVEILDKQKYIQDEKDKAKHEADKVISVSWENTSEEKRIEMIQDALNAGGSEAVRKLFETIINGSN